MADNRYHIEKEVARRMGLTLKQVNKILRSRDKMTRGEMEQTRDDPDYKPRSIHYHKLGYFQHRSVGVERGKVSYNNRAEKLKQRDQEDPITF